jgi:DNA-binding FadR family transcriptional regulator
MKFATVGVIRMSFRREKRQKLLIIELPSLNNATFPTGQRVPERAELGEELGVSLTVKVPL